MDKKALLKSIPEGEERLLFAKALDQAYFCVKRREPAFTDFMDRAKCGRFAERLRNVGEFRTVLFGGMEDCERLMLGFCAPEEELLPEQFPICSIRIRRKNKKFGQSGLSHRDYLGSAGAGYRQGKAWRYSGFGRRGCLFCGSGNCSIHMYNAGTGFQNGSSRRGM